MVTLKAIKNDYKLLTMRERFGLYQRAILREDEAELDAIMAATPKRRFDVIDFYFLREEVARADTINLLLRLGHYGMFNFFSRRSDEIADEGESDNCLSHASVSAFLYVIETDSWQLVCEELGFEASFFRQLASAISFSVEMMEKSDEIVRRLAFTKNQAEKFMRESSKYSRQIEDYSIKTIKERIQFYRSLIEEV
jgi:hypothetical protein